jgi:DNA-binding beta-propeller fold protein YncE
VDLTTNRVSNVSTIAYARHLALTPDNRTLYVSYQAGGPGGSWGHDAIGYFDTKTDRLLGSIHGFPNVGEHLIVSPDGSQLWEDGGDACILGSYDHVGCPFVPAALVNVITTRDNKLIKAVALEGVLTNSISFFPGGTAVVAAGETLVLIDTKQFSIVGSVPIRSLGNLAIAKDGSFAYVPLAGEEGVAVLELRHQVHAIALSNLSESTGTFPVAILNTKDFDANSVDPTTLTLNGKRVQRTLTGTAIATHQHIQSLRNYDLVVNFPADGLQPGTNATLQGKTFSGVSIRATVHIGK